MNLKNKNLLMLFSGGRTSGFLAKFIKLYSKYENYNKLFIFGNTGKEREETLEFVNKCDKEFGLDLVWVEAVVRVGKVINAKKHIFMMSEWGKIYNKIKKRGLNPDKIKSFRIGTTYKVVTFETASRKGEPFEAVIKKYGLPSKLYRHCTRELKEKPIHTFAKEFFGSSDYVSALGIRSDEKHRLKVDPKKIYPLAELNIDKYFIRTWWNSQSFDLNLKDYEGNCDDCFLKSKRKRMTIALENPGIPKWWISMEKLYSNEKQPMFDVRNRITYEEITELSNSNFNKVKDDSEGVSQFDPELDLEFSCYCKSS